MPGLIIVFLFMIVGAALTYVAIYKINPESFKISASIMKFAMFSMEIKLPQNRTRKALTNRAEHGNR
jgi:hypothetical protein